MLNKVTLIGRLGADPEVRYIPNGVAVANVRLATSRRWKDKQTGDKLEETEWHRVIFFSRLAEISAEFLKKGSQIYIEGRIQTQKWQDKDGHDRYTTEIVAEQMQMLGSKNSTQPETTSPNISNPTPSSSTTIADDFDDDIPFF